MTRLTLDNLTDYLADVITYQVGNSSLRITMEELRPGTGEDVLQGVVRAELRLMAALPFELKKNVATMNADAIAALLEGMFSPFRDQLIEASQKVEEEWAKVFPRLEDRERPAPEAP